MSAETPRTPKPPRRDREDAPTLGHFPLIDGSGNWMAAIIDWTPESERIHTIGERCLDMLAAIAASERMANERRTRSEIAP